MAMLTRLVDWLLDDEQSGVQYRHYPKE